jgi:hypothetical protein
VERGEITRTIRESVTVRRLVVTLGVAGTMGGVEWLGLGHPVGLVFGLAMGILALLVAPLPWLWLLPWGLKRPPLAIVLRAAAILALGALVACEMAWPAPGIFRLPAGQQGAIPEGVEVSIEPDGRVSF